MSTSQPALFQTDEPAARRRTQGGIATADVVLSAHTCGGNAELFPKILDLHVSPGAVIADVTYGSGVFWRNIPDGKYRLKPTDIADGIDCRTESTAANFRMPTIRLIVSCSILPIWKVFFGGREHKKPGRERIRRSPASIPTATNILKMARNGIKRCWICTSRLAMRHTGFYVPTVYSL
jgi:hypothetical protein